VHKKYTTFCVMDEKGAIVREGRCANDALPGVFLEGEGEKRAVMEAGPNWSYVYDMIEPLVDGLMLAHPQRVRAIATARVKTDAIDARTLAHLLRADLIPPAYVPEVYIRRRREMLRYRLDLVKQRTAMKNRVHALLAQVGAASPVTDLFGRTGRAWMGGLQLDGQRRYELGGYLRVLDCLSEEIAEATQRVREAARPDRDAQLLMTIPGIAELTAWTLLAEIGDVRRFPDARHLVSYAGFAPRVRSSGGRTKLGHITKQGPSALRWVLIEAAHIAVRKPGHLQAQYHRLRRGKSSAVAITACARQLLVAVYHMLMRGEAYRVDGSPTGFLTSEVA
jgi:transposase